MSANGKFWHVAMSVVLATGLMAGCSSSNDPAPVAAPPAVVTPPPPPPPPPPPTTISGSVKSGTVNLDQYSTISLTPAAGGAVINIMAASNGTYSANVAAGTYAVTVKRPGYAPYTQSTFTVTAQTNNTLNVSLAALAANTYVKSADCGVCHTSHYASFRQTGHPYKLSKVTGNAPPVIPFNNEMAGLLPRLSGATNTLGTPAAWTDVSYVIGGFSWKTRLIDKNGYVVTGTKVQHNLDNNTITAYNASVKDEPYDCGNCHNTGWRAYDATLNPNRQDNLPGMAGTFAEPGVQCEACHGAGSKHAQTSSRNDITLLARPRTPDQLKASNAGFGLPIACGECHMREGERKAPTYVSAFDTLRLAAGEPLPAMGGRIRASGGLMQHRVTWEETLGVNPDDPKLASTRSTSFMNTHGYCSTCHNPHGSVVARNKTGYTGQPGVDASKQSCLTCHPQYDPARRLQLGMRNLNCIDCHMPNMLRNATDTPAVGDKPKLGDERTHLFRIRLNSSFKQFNTAGNVAYPWITPAYACATCHDGVTLFAVRAPITDTYEFHDNN